MRLTYDTIYNNVKKGLQKPVKNGKFIEIEGSRIPVAPKNIDDMGVSPEVLSNLILKLAYMLPKFTTRYAAEKLCIPLHIISVLLEQLQKDGLLEILGQPDPFNYRFTITDRGRERAARLLEISGYVGPAPVSLADYTTNLEWQFQHLPEPTPEKVKAAISGMVMPKDDLHLAGLALISRRTLFIYGPPGNGKTMLGHLLHNAMEGHLWIPYCICIDNHIIRIFDLQCHKAVPVELQEDMARKIDHRWIRIRIPFVVVGGELTLEALDLMYVPSLGYYEAPLHFKANGGIFLLDDFGCQHVEPYKLLSRWILPLERQVDYLTLQTGQQLEVPFRQMLIISTNLNPKEVMMPAFLRRIGYRLQLKDPSPERYAEIFRRYAAGYNLAVQTELIEHLLARYHAEKRSLRCCEPRDLIERVVDICRFQREPIEINEKTLDLAWSGYFGNGLAD
ncbi:MAG: hypothetical protein ACMUHX_02180 [bacterium]